MIVRDALETKVVTIHRVEPPGESFTGTALPTDIVAIRGQQRTKFVDATGALQPHPDHVAKSDQTVTHVSHSRSEEIEWRSIDPFSIARITDHDAQTDARPFAWDFPRHSVPENGMHVVRSGVPEPDAHRGDMTGTPYKAWIKFDDEALPLDPDFNCLP